MRVSVGVWFEGEESGILGSPGSGSLLYYFTKRVPYVFFFTIWVSFWNVNVARAKLIVWLVLKIFLFFSFVIFLLNLSSVRVKVFWVVFFLFFFFCEEPIRMWFITCAGKWVWWISVFLFFAQQHLTMIHRIFFPHFSIIFLVISYEIKKNAG